MAADRERADIRSAAKAKQVVLSFIRENWEGSQQEQCIRFASYVKPLAFRRMAIICMSNLSFRAPGLG